MTAATSTVYIVDDDLSVREALEDLLSSFGFNVNTFGSAKEYVAATRADTPACLLLDVELPDINGLELQRLLARGEHPPIIFITGYGDIPSSVRAIKAGAIDFLAKPFNPEDLLTAIDSAIQQHCRTRISRTELTALRVLYATLTAREREVCALVVSGMLNKQAAAQLGIREVTLQIHRGQVMRKMEAQSLADLVRMAVKLEIATQTSAEVGEGLLQNNGAGDDRSSQVGCGYAPAVTEGQKSAAVLAAGRSSVADDHGAAHQVSPPWSPVPGERTSLSRARG